MLFPTTLDFEDNKIPDTFTPQAHIFYHSRVLDYKDGALAVFLCLAIALLWPDLGALLQA